MSTPAQNPKSVLRRVVAALGVGVGIAGFHRSAHAQQTTYTWVGNTDAAIGTATNWSATLSLPANNDILAFGSAGLSGTSLNYDRSVQVGQLVFNNGAAAYSFTGNGISLSGNGTITNNSSATQTFNTSVTTGQGTINANSGLLVFKSGLNWGSGATLSIKGNGQAEISATSGGGTLIVNTGGTLTISGGTTTVSSGTLNVAAGSGGGNGTLNLNGGKLDLTGSGTTTIGSGAIGTVNVTGGELTIGSSAGVVIGKNSSGTGTLNISSGTITINGGTDIQMGVGATGATGTINLTGGTLVTGRQFIAGTGSGTVGKAYFNFDGGVLQASSNQTDWLRSSGTYALTETTVKSGGAIIDSSGFNVAINNDLQNGGGGLTKIGAGTLTLGGANAYTGATTISAGTLALSAGASLASTELSIASGAVFDVSKTTGAYDLASISTTIYLAETNASGFINAGSNALLLGNALTLNFTTSDLGTSASYDLFASNGTTDNFSSVTFAGSFAGSLSRDGSLWRGYDSSNLYHFSFDQMSGELTVSAIPEPSTYAAIAGALALGAVVWRRRRSHA